MQPHRWAARSRQAPGSIGGLSDPGSHPGPRRIRQARTRPRAMQRDLARGGSARVGPAWGWLCNRQRSLRPRRTRSPLAEQSGRAPRIRVARRHSSAECTSGPPPSGPATRRAYHGRTSRGCPPHTCQRRGSTPMTTDQRAADAAATDTPTTARMVIGGETIDAAGGQTFEVVNPATGLVIATAPLGGREDVDRAVAAARAAFDDPKGWAHWAAGKRGRSLAKLADLIKKNSEELAWLESRNVGKPLGGARGAGV